VDEPFADAREAVALTLARAWLMRGEAGRAATLVESVRSAAEQSGRIGTLVEAMALQSRVCWANGERDHAVGLLAQGLALAEPGGFVRQFADEGPALVPVLAELAASQRNGHWVPPSPAYVGILLETTGGSGHAETSDRPAQPFQPLSARELEVLQGMATGAPNEQFARDLVIVATTVKSHINGIFRKLGASNRLEAVARARAAGLLPFTGR
jgi:LuxR family maltose regulon positive regulatory protein